MSDMNLHFPSVSTAEILPEAATEFVNSQLTVRNDAHFAVPSSQNGIHVRVWVSTHDVAPKRLNMQSNKHTNI